MNSTTTSSMALEAPSSSSPPPPPPPPAKTKKQEKKFDFAAYPTRHVVLKVAYHGHNHEGLAKQDHTDNTIETILVQALQRLRLIAEDTPPQKFSRCGRTDKGVSALGNAFSVVLRSSKDSDENPLDYPLMINKALPPTVRVIAWSYVPDSFDARFSCLYRCYRYYFVHHQLNLAAMRKAASYLIGKWNFRNFCKLDVVNVDNFEREILHVDLQPAEGPAGGLVSYVEIHGNAFLYHQIRCTMTVLFLVGRGLEEPEVVQALLTRGDAKPIYPMADHSPLILWDCVFDAKDVQWRSSSAALALVTTELADIAAALLIRAVAAAEMKAQLLQWFASPSPSRVSEPSSSSSSPQSGATYQQHVLAAVKPFDHPEDMWEPTGCDWTSVALQDKLRCRQHEMHRLKNSAASGGSATVAGGGGGGGSYEKLLEREVEATYEERVSSLKGGKRARQEENQAKKTKSGPPRDP